MNEQTDYRMTTWPPSLPDPTYLTCPCGFTAEGKDRETAHRLFDELHPIPHARTQDSQE